jgi:hypothetical protein
MATYRALAFNAPVSNYRKAAQPLINRPFCPDKAILAGFSGNFANAHYQCSQGAMTTEIFYA